MPTADSLLCLGWAVKQTHGAVPTASARAAVAHVCSHKRLPAQDAAGHYRYTIRQPADAYVLRDRRCSAALMALWYGCASPTTAAPIAGITC